jgi:hypothetical protein
MSTSKIKGGKSLWLELLDHQHHQEFSNQDNNITKSQTIHLQNHRYIPPFHFLEVPKAFYKASFTTSAFNMQFRNIILAITSFSSLATATPQDDADRETDLQMIELILRDARSESIADVQSGGGRGRKLSSSSCSDACTQCRNGAIGSAVADIALCGIAGLALDVATQGATTILEIAGFFACEGKAISELNKSEAECASLN